MTPSSLKQLLNSAIMPFGGPVDSVLGRELSKCVKQYGETQVRARVYKVYSGECSNSSGADYIFRLSLEPLVSNMLIEKKISEKVPDCRKLLCVKTCD